MRYRNSNKKGYFFSIDAISAAGILLTGIFLLFYVMSSRPVETPSYHLSEDMLNVMEKTTIDNLSKADYPYIYSLIEDGSIVNVRNSVMEQAGEFYYLNTIDTSINQPYLKKSMALVQNITYALVPAQNGFRVRIYDAVNNNDPGTELVLIENSLVGEEKAAVKIALKKIIFGVIINENSVRTVWGPYVIETSTWR